MTRMRSVLADDVADLASKTHARTHTRRGNPRWKSCLDPVPGCQASTHAPVPAYHLSKKQKKTKARRVCVTPPCFWLVCAPGWDLAASLGSSAHGHAQRPSTDKKADATWERAPPRRSGHRYTVPHHLSHQQYAMESPPFPETGTACA